MGKKIEGNLTAKQELFCQIFAQDKDCFGNGTQAYIKAFKPKKTYKTIRVEAHRLLTKPNILARIRELLNIYISEEVVDRELGQVILQYADLSSKVAAIREYNRVKGRLAPQKIKLIDENDEIDDKDIEEELGRIKSEGTKRVRKKLGKKSSGEEKAKSA